MRSPIHVLIAIYLAYLRKRANHFTNVAIKAGFHSKAVEVIYHKHIELQRQAPSEDGLHLKVRICSTL